MKGCALESFPCRKACPRLRLGSAQLHGQGHEVYRAYTSMITCTELLTNKGFYYYSPTVSVLFGCCIFAELMTEVSLFRLHVQLGRPRIPMATRKKSFCPVASQVAAQQPSEVRSCKPKFSTVQAQGQRLQQAQTRFWHGTRLEHRHVSRHLRLQVRVLVSEPLYC